MKPVFKWVGGKTSSMDRLFPLFDKTKETYVEPFLGGGGSLLYVLGHVEETNYKLFFVSDSCQRVIDAFLCIERHPQELCDLLREYEERFNNSTKDENKEYYYNILRPSLETENDLVKKTAIFITLMKTCINGLYRVNKKGVFNAAVGSYKKIHFDYNNLMRVSKSLSRVAIMTCDYRDTINLIGRDSFVFIDPPYYGATKEPYHDAWNKDTYVSELVDYMKKCHENGASVGSTNYVDFLQFMPSEFESIDYETTVKFQNNSGKREVYMQNFLHK